MKSISKILWGLILIMFGLAMCLNVLGLTEIDLFFDGWWTLFIIVPSLIGLIDGNDRLSSFVCLSIGVALLLSAQGLISLQLVLRLLVPVIIVTIGMSFLFKGLFGDKIKNKIKSVSPDELTTIAVVMNDEYRVLTDEFKGAIVETVFGHCILDLSSVTIKGEASLKMSSVFSKIDVILPKNVTVKTNSTKIFGSINSFPKSVDSKKKDILYVDATSIFGGIVLK